MDTRKRASKLTVLGAHLCSKNSKVLVPVLRNMTRHGGWDFVELIVEDYKGAMRHYLYGLKATSLGC